MAKSLLLLRHAKSSWKHPELADRDRPLNKRGKHDALRMGKLLKEQDLLPDAILSSTAVRAQDTASEVAKSCGYDERQITCAESLYASGPEEYLNALRRLPDDPNVVLVVGHNPGMEEYLEVLTGQPEAMPTAAVALVKLPIKKWSELDGKTKGKLAAVWRPKEL